MKPQFNKTHLETLKALGLNDIQTHLYLTSLTHGMLSVLELSKLTKINRQQIYEEAEKMVDLGIYEITRKQRRKYIAVSPNKLTKVGEKKIQETQQILSKLTAIVPQLESLALPQKDKVIIKYYEGLPKIREAYNNELQAAKNTEGLSFTGSIDEVFKFFPESYWDKWNSQFKKQNSTARVLVHNSQAASNFALKHSQYKIETRWLHNFPLNTNIDIFNNTVLIVSFYDETAIWIESQVIAQTYRIMFKTLWNLAKPFN